MRVKLLPTIRLGPIALLIWAPALLAFQLYPGGFGYTHNKWGDTAIPSGATVYWSIMPAGTAGAAYCGDACPGTSSLVLPNFYDWNSTTYTPVNLTDPQIMGYIRSALRAWSAVAGVTFVYVPNDSGVPIDDPAAEPPATGQIRIGVFDMGDCSSAAGGYAPPPNGFIPNSSQFATGSGDVMFNSACHFQHPEGAEGSHLESYPDGGGFYLNDFEGLLLHELGHALGLAHSDVIEGVMCSWPAACIWMNAATNAINRLPNPDDVAGMQTLYGPPVDSDADTVPDAIDNCTLVANSTQCDADGDGFGNRCDADLNNNGATNAQDYGIFRTRLGTTDAVADLNCNGTVNAQDYGILRVLLGATPGPSGLTP